MSDVRLVAKRETAGTRQKDKSRQYCIIGQVAAQLVSLSYTYAGRYTYAEKSIE